MQPRQLEYVPSSFRVISHIRLKLAGFGCCCIVQAAAPSRVTARGLLGPGLLACLLVAKLATCPPLYCQLIIYDREGA